MKPLKVISILLFVSMWLFPAALAAAESAATPARADANTPVSNAPAASSPKDNGFKPVNIVSDLLEADDVEKVAIFTGNVVARQEDMVLNGDLMRVYYIPVSNPNPPQTAAGGDETSDNEIERIEVEGNVKITRGDRVAMSDKAVYLAKEKPRVIILTGAPRVWRDKDVLSGQKIKFYPDQDRVLVESGEGQRVKGTFYQKAEEGAARPGQNAGSSPAPARDSGGPN